MRDRVVTIARSWIGTPYIHQASCRGAGTDCLGLILGIWREVVGPDPEGLPAYTRDWSEPQRDESLWADANRHLVALPAGEIVAGDVLLFRMRDGGVAKHLGIVGSGWPAPTLIHAYSGHAVLETSLSLPWRRRIAARFEFPRS